MRYFNIAVRDPMTSEPLSVEQIHAKLQVALWPQGDIAYFVEVHPQEKTETT